MKARVGLIVAAASFVTVSGAMAADLYIPPPAAPAPPAFSWDGPYIGAKIGGGVGTETDDLSTLTFFPPAADSFALSGFNGGVYGGYNWDLSGLVVGVEGDLDYAALTGSHPFGYEAFEEVDNDGPSFDKVDRTGSLSLSTDWQAFAKARIGLPFDRFLLYATAGIGLAHATLTAKADPDGENDVDGPEGGSSSNIHIGGVVGVGGEYAFTDQLVGRAEVDFAGFGAKSYQPGDFSPVNASWTQTTGTVGLSLKF